MFTIVLSLIACSPGTTSDTAAEIEPVDPAVEVFELLRGDFDSINQASSDPNYFEISLRMCAFEMPDLGPQVLYVEQAALSSIDSPYRQRIYLVERVEDRVASHVYTMETDLETQMVGACDNPDSISVSIDQVAERVGCTVWLAAGDEGYTGGTEGTECSSSLNGAAYATSVVQLSASKIESWDQGWDRNGIQVWGATSGAYIFDRAN